MKNILKIGLFVQVSLLLTINSCIKEEFDPRKLDTEIVINPGVAAPLGFIHYELDEILKDSTKSWSVTVDNDSLIRLEYEALVVSQQASEFLVFSEIIDTGSIRNNSKYDLELGLISYPYSFNRTDTVNFILSDQFGPVNTQIDSIHVDSLEIVVNRFSEYQLLGNLILKSSKIMKKKLNKWDTWSARVPVLGPAQTVIVDDVTIILSNNPSEANLVPITFDLRLENSRGVVPAGNSILDYSIQIRNLDFKTLFGHLGQITFIIPSQNVLIDFYTELVDGTFNFIEPQMKFYFDNTFGLPIQIITNELYATSGGGITTPIEGPGLPSEENIFIINYPTINEFGRSAYDSISINQENTNLDLVLNAQPTSITYGLEARTNPLNNDTYNFIKGNSRLNVRAKLILPIYGNTNFLNIEDSIMYDFGDFFRNPPEEIKRMALRLNFKNGFPVDIRSQIYMLDINHNPVDSVFEEEFIIEAGKDTNGDWIVEPLMSEPYEVELTRTKFDNFVNSRYLYFKGRVNTPDSDIPVNYKFYSFYFLDAYIGAVGDLELNSTGN